MGEGYFETTAPLLPWHGLRDVVSSLDGQPAKLFFLLVAPEDAPGEHLKALARVSRIMKNGKLRDALLKARDAKEIRVLIAREDG